MGVRESIPSEKNCLNESREDVSKCREKKLDGAWDGETEGRSKLAKDVALSNSHLGGCEERSLQSA